MKQTAFKLLKKAGMVREPLRRAYVTQMRIDPFAPDAIQMISEGPVLTEFSHPEFTLSKNSAGKVIAVPRR
jgi:hypothetical protein